MVRRKALLRDARRAMIEPLEPRSLLAVTGPHAVTVNVFRDLNRNGVRNSNDPPLAGFHVEIDSALDAAGNLVRPAGTTDARGQVRFAFYIHETWALAGSRVRVTFPRAKWRPTTGGTSGNRVSESAAASVNMGMTDWGRVTGRVVTIGHDANNTPVDRPLAGRVVFEDANRNGRLDPGERSTTSGSDGNFRMELRAGKRTLRVALSKHWTATAGQKLVRSQTFNVFSNVEPFRAVLRNPVTIDVLAAYTPALANGRSAFEMFRHVRGTFMQANDLFANSDTNVVLRPVAAVPTDYVESGAMDADLDRLMGQRDGVMDEVHAARDREKADLVMLLTRRQAGERTAGLAFQYLGGRDPGALGFSVVSTERRSDVPPITVAHEVGHNLGAGHDLETVTRDGEPVTARYAHGYVFGRRNTLDRYFDVMAWGTLTQHTGYQHLLPYFSTPDFRHLGEPVGNRATADNARIIREVAPLVAQYR